MISPLISCNDIILVLNDSWESVGLDCLMKISFYLLDLGINVRYY